jgi:hypothetical protein
MGMAGMANSLLPLLRSVSTFGPRREEAREAIRSGRLPSRRQDFTRGGSGSGGVCPVCEEIISSSVTELEIGFNDGAAGFVVYQIHYQCFAAWEIERTTTDQ